mmetsp:Transcript_58176/g.101872  ORF Transcript_58176/g.101872 Transcript_58176/m.101872 type:complete len:125 (-) Transcript_58176:85-459(-)
MASPGDSKKLIDSLLTTEKQAEELIATARKNRQQKMREAADAAAEEMKDFKAAQEVEFQKKLSTTAAYDPAVEFEDITKKELVEVEEEFKKNKDKTIEYVVECVWDVQMTLSDTQKQALKAGAV